MRTNLPALLLVAVSCVGVVQAQDLERSSPDCSPEALTAAREGADRGAAASIYLMARYYSTGKCVAGDGKLAMENYWKAASLNYPPAFYNLGIISAGNQAFPDAELLFFRGAQLGHRGSELQLGILYSLAPPPVANDEKAYAWLSVTVARGEPISSEAKDQLARVSARMSPTSIERGSTLHKSLTEKFGSIPAFQAK